MMKGTQRESMTRASQITPRLKVPLRNIAAFIEEHGHGPTSKQLAEMGEVTEAAIRQQLRDLAAQGFTRRTNAWRSLHLTPKGKRAVEA